MEADTNATKHQEAPRGMGQNPRETLINFAARKVDSKV